MSKTTLSLFTVSAIFFLLAAPAHPLRAEGNTNSDATGDTLFANAYRLSQIEDSSVRASTAGQMFNTQPTRAPAGPGLKPLPAGVGYIQNVTISGSGIPVQNIPNIEPGTTPTGVNCSAWGNMTAAQFAQALLGSGTGNGAHVTSTNWGGVDGLGNANSAGSDGAAFQMSNPQYQITLNNGQSYNVGLIINTIQRSGVGGLQALSAETGIPFQTLLNNYNALSSGQIQIGNTGAGQGTTNTGTGSNNAGAPTPTSTPAGPGLAPLPGEIGYIQNVTISGSGIPVQNIPNIEPGTAPTGVNCSAWGNQAAAQFAQSLLGGTGTGAHITTADWGGTNGLGAGGPFQMSDPQYQITLGNNSYNVGLILNTIQRSGVGGLQAIAAETGISFQTLLNNYNALTAGQQGTPAPTTTSTPVTTLATTATSTPITTLATATTTGLVSNEVVSATTNPGPVITNGSTTGTGGTDVGGTDVGDTDVGGTDVGGTDVGGTDVGGTDVGGTDVGGTDTEASDADITE